MDATISALGTRGYYSGVNFEVVALATSIPVAATCSVSGQGGTNILAIATATWGNLGCSNAPPPFQQYPQSYSGTIPPRNDLFTSIQVLNNGNGSTVTNVAGRAQLTISLQPVR